jgi:hypothetical protein
LRARPVLVTDCGLAKVQYSGIEAKFRNDLSTTIDFCKLAMKQHVSLRSAMQEIEK